MHTTSRILPVGVLSFFILGGCGDNLPVNNTAGQAGALDEGTADQEKENETNRDNDRPETHPSDNVGDRDDVKDGENDDDGAQDRHDQDHEDEDEDDRDEEDGDEHEGDEDEDDRDEEDGDDPEHEGDEDEDDRDEEDGDDPEHEGDEDGQDYDDHGDTDRDDDSQDDPAATNSQGLPVGDGGCRDHEDCASGVCWYYELYQEAWCGGQTCTARCTTDEDCVAAFTAAGVPNPQASTCYVREGICSAADTGADGLWCE